MSKVHFLMQGLKKERNHFNELQKLIGEDGAKEIILSSAFLNSNGVYALKDSLANSRDKLSVYIGCRNGITSKQSLEDLLALGIKPYVVDTGSESFIFHPKSFLAIGESKALSIIGSANLTPGGLLNNIESSTIIELDLSTADDRKYVEDFRNSFLELKDKFPEHVFEVSSVETVNRLFEEGRLIDETKVRMEIKGSSEGAKTVGPTMKLERERISFPKKNRSTSIVPAKDSKPKEEMLLANLEQLLIKVWQSKPLTKRDLNIHVEGNTNVTGSMLLKKGLYEIDQQTYFRDTVFVNLDWEYQDGKPFEYAKAKFGFFIEGIEYPVHELLIKHDPRTDTATYNQKQPMTHLIWGDAKSFVANPNLLGKQFTLYRVKDANDKFVIKIGDVTE